MKTVLIALAFAVAAGQDEEKTLFDFEEASELEGWSSVDAAKEPPVKVALSSEGATSGKQALTITFGGGEWPAVSTRRVPEDWSAWHSLKAEVTAPRPCVVGFTLMQEKSQRGVGWDALISRWTKTEFLKAGRNDLVVSLDDPSANGYGINPKKYGKAVSFEIFMYAPHEGESIRVDHVRVSPVKIQVKKPRQEFKVVGTDVVVSGEVAGVRDLWQKAKDRWQAPVARTVAEIEADAAARAEELRKSHPHATLAILRDGEKLPDGKVYRGWQDAYFTSHGPDSNTAARSENVGRRSGYEIFMRHRAPLMRVDFSPIPAGAEILEAKLMVVRAKETYDAERHPLKNPTMWVVEPCNRPWVEEEVNAYQYAKDKFWKTVGGMHSYSDPDPDFLPLYLAFGPGQGKVNVWDFTRAVKFWTEEGHPNHGFMLHCDHTDWIGSAHSREAAELKDRPAVLVIYEPKR